MALLYELNQVGQREDLADIIAVVDAKDTPFVSMIPKGKQLGNTTFDWQMDGYADPSVTAQADGVDVSSYTNPAASRKKMSTYGHFKRRNGRVSVLSENIATVAGMGKKAERARGIAHNLVEIKRDMELICLDDNDNLVDDGAGGAGYETAGMGRWLNGTGPTTPLALDTLYRTPSGSRPTTATGSITETTVQDMLKSMYENTGHNGQFDGFVGTTLKRAITGLTSTSLTDGGSTNGFGATSIRSFNQDLGDTTFRSHIDVFEGDFGSIRLHPDLYIAEGGDEVQFKGYVCPMNLLELRYGMLPRVKDLPDAGAGPAWLVETFFGLCVKNPLAFGMFDGAS